MSRILSRISMLTGQISSHALHDVHAHISSARDALEQRVGGDGDLAVDADRRRHRRRRRCAAMTSPIFSTISRGSSGLPVACAGHTRRAAAAHRAGVGVEQLLPGEVLDGRRAERLELGLHEVRHRLHRALGPVAGPQVHVQRRREHVPQHRGRQDHEERDERDDVRRPRCTWCQRRRACSATSRRTSADERVADERPLLERRAGRRSAMRNASATKPVTPMHEERAEDRPRARAWS